MNPCGRAVDWIQEPFEVDARIHDSPDAPLVRQRWVFTDQPFLPIDPPTIFLNRIWDNDDVEELLAGMLAPFVNNYVQDARWKLPALKFSGHMCKPEYLQTGEPWPIPAGTPSTVYLDGWIPECCVMACAAEGCSQEPVNDKPASQRMQYAIDAKDATGSTPGWRQTVADALVVSGGDWPGSRQEWLPLGTDGPAQLTITDLSRPDGTPYSHVEQYTFDALNSVSITQSVDGFLLDVVQDGVATSLGLRVLAGEGQLYGTNLVIAPSVLPPDVVIVPPFTTSAIYYRTSPTGWAPVTIGSGVSFVAGTLSATGSGGTVTSVGISTSSFGVTVGGGPIIGAGTLTVDLDPDLNALAALSSTGFATRTGAGTWAQRSLTGTANKIDVTDGDGVSGAPTITVSATYVGQTSITTLGTITTGTWTGTAVAPGYGGTGNAFTQFTGPTTAIKTFTLPDSSATIYTDQTTALAQIVAGTWVGLASITTVGTLTTGATGAGFTIALTTSTVTGTLPTANLPSGVVVSANGTLAAAGTTQGTAATISSRSTVCTASAGATGVILPTGEGAWYINHSSVTPLNVYPPSGAHFSLLAANLPITLNQNNTKMFVRMSATQYAVFDGNNMN